VLLEPLLVDAWFVSQRFFASSPITIKQVTLAGDEGHHLARVMRAKPGDVIVLFDGGGAEFDARVIAVGRSSVELEIVGRREVDRESPLAVTLGVALPKGERQRFLVEKAVELGVARLVPLETQRGVAQPTESAQERLRRAVIEASKQCGRNRLMEVAAATPLGKYATAAPQGAARLIAHPDGQPIPNDLSEVGQTGSGVFFGPTGNHMENLPTEKVSRALEPAPSFRPAVYLAVGPEGGFTDEEIAAAHAAGWRPVSLGSRILRVETAALALAARLVID
jgi:16S rRNA (uracil1498-N3)-methyltransferase